MKYRVIIEYASDVLRRRWCDPNISNKLHRLEGPAIEYISGTKHWCQNDQRHRLDGPAAEFSDGSKVWAIKGKLYTEHDFKKAIKRIKNNDKRNHST